MPPEALVEPKKAKDEHFTPLKPGMKLSDLRPELNDKTQDEVESEEALQKRVAAVRIVADLPMAPKLHLAIATLKAGGYKVLYVGSDRAAADKAAVFDPAKHVQVDLFFSPSANKSFDAVRQDVKHFDPFKPTDTVKTFKARQEKEALAAATAAREHELESLKDEDLKAALANAGIPFTEGFNREDMISAILDKEFPEPEEPAPALKK